jgi:type II secretory pathway component PulF
LNARKKEQMMMKQSENEETLEPLRQAGWTTSEIEQLCRFRDTSLKREQRIRQTKRRPAFVRWLLRMLQEGLPLPSQENDTETVQPDSAVWD